MSHARTIFAAALLGAAVVVGCDREEREFHGDPSLASVATAVQTTDLVPGLPPATQPAGSAQDATALRDEFERNVFQLSEGNRLYTQMNCAGCHAQGGGDIGPALSDEKWIYGGGAEQIFATLVQGRPNGMPAYGARLTRQQVWQLTAYVRSMSGLLPKTVSPSRNDHMQASPPPNATDAPTTMTTMPPTSAVKGEGTR